MRTDSVPICDVLYLKKFDNLFINIAKSLKKNMRDYKHVGLNIENYVMMLLVITLQTVTLNYIDILVLANTRYLYNLFR